MSHDEITWPPQEVTPPTTVALNNPLEEEMVPMTTTSPQTKVDMDSEIKSIVQTLTCGNVNTTYEIDVYKYVVPTLVSQLEAESIKAKEKGSEDKEGLEATGSKEQGEKSKPTGTPGSGSKNVEGIVLLEKTLNVEQAKKNQSADDS